MISIAGLSKAEVLAALYNRAQPLGMGFLHYDPKPMSIEEATEILKSSEYFDYLKGRVMKVSLKNSTVDERLYDRDNGQGAFAEVITALRRI